MNKQPDETSASPTAYEREFVRTVLRLNGVVGAPTDAELGCATRTFEQYGIRVMDARRRDLVIDYGWLRGRMPEQAAVERAFLFVRFDSVLKTTGVQSRALYDWLKTGTSH
jgi:hypothetical protein